MRVTARYGGVVGLAGLAAVVVWLVVRPGLTSRDGEATGGDAAGQGVTEVGRGDSSAPVAPPLRGGPPSEFQSAEEARGVQRQFRAISEKVAPAVVAISHRDPTSARVTLEGSGVVIDASGVILTHGHHGRACGTVLQVRFPDGRTVDAAIESVYAGRGRDFSLLKTQPAGPFPSASLRRDPPPPAGERCFHFGCPGSLSMARSPVLRLGRIAGNGQWSTYANCLVFTGDSGGPLFDFNGRVIGILVSSLGPYLAHPGQWASISKIIDGGTFLSPYDDTEVRRLGFLDKNRAALDTRKCITNTTCPDLHAAARRATVEVLIDEKPVILGTVVDAGGIVLSKRSELLTRRGVPLGPLTCRMFSGETAPAKVVAESHDDDLVLLQLPKRGLTPAPWSEQDGPLRGTIVIVPVPHEDTSETGVVGVEHPFAVPANTGRVQLLVEATKAGVTVAGTNNGLDLGRYGRLVRGSLRVGDVIEQIDGEDCPDLAAFQARTTNVRFVGGEFLSLSLRRSGTASRVALPVEETEDGITYRDYAERSLRASGFRAVVSHDAIVPRPHCGGPVVDWEGRVVGVNIARLHRYSTLAIPQRAARSRVRELLGTIKQ